VPHRTADHGLARLLLHSGGHSVIAVKPDESGESAGSHSDWTSDEKNVKMDIKTSFFYVLSEVQKDSEDVSAGIGQFNKIRYMFSGI
jgi:hypothetical protein